LPQTALCRFYSRNQGKIKLFSNVIFWTKGKTMKLKYTILYVDDVAASVKFYEDALGLKLKMLHGSGEYAEMETGETSLSFCARALMTQMGKETLKADPKKPASEIAFETDDVTAAFEKAVANGAMPISEPTMMPWNQVVSYVADLDGFLIEICSPILDA
jgi:catechol 2,3-dioxygenase-like lactoylglutathione lyase family enzyme